MEIFHGVLYGFQVALQPINLLYCFVGVFIGTLVGVLPGLGPAAAIALLLPSTFAASPVSAIIMLAGIYYGAMYGGSTTSILMNIPGEAASVVTCLDGHAMARQGRAGAALGISAFGSFIAGTLSVVALTFLAPFLARVTLSFGPPEYFALMVLGLTLLTYFARESMVKALMMAAVGLLCGTVGQDVISGRFRFAFGDPDVGGRPRAGPGHHGALRHLRSAPQPRAARRGDGDLRPADDGAAPDSRRLAGVDAADPARIGAGILPRYPSRGRRHHRLLRVLRRREARVQAS